MTNAEFELLTDPDIRRTIEENLDRDPARVALDKHIPHAALIATQVKYLQRARRKLPSYYRARCIIPPTAFEQSSSEECAAHKSGEGRRCLDLTCGLGVDSLYLSQHFDEVVSVERDPVLAAVARENFGRLGIRNVKVINAPAEEVVAGAAAATGITEAAGTCSAQTSQTTYTTGSNHRSELGSGQYDMIYVDPDRRDAHGRRQVLLEACSPDIRAMLPQLQRLTPRLVVKNSPLFDVDEAVRIFGNGCRVEAVALGGECKELLVEWRRGSTSTRIAATAIGEGSFETDAEGRHHASPFGDPTNAACLIMPDVSLRKARISESYISERFPEAGYCSPEGFYLAAQLPPNSLSMCRIYRIEAVIPFGGKELKRHLAARGIRRITILKRDFNVPTAEILRRAAVTEGDQAMFAFVECGGKSWALEITGPIVG